MGPDALDPAELAKMGPPWKVKVHPHQLCNAPYVSTKTLRRLASHVIPTDLDHPPSKAIRVSWLDYPTLH